MSYQPKDYYFHKAKAENYLARSVFKLQEIQKRFKIFKPGQIVLDLGAAPGSWSQYAVEQIGSQGRVLALDLQPLRISHQQLFSLQQNIADFNPSTLPAPFSTPKAFDLILSDLAPKTTGIRITDQARSLELCELAFQIVQSNLVTRGHFVCKIFENSDLKLFLNRLLRSFKTVQRFRPKSTRKESQESFIIGLNYLN